MTDALNRVAFVHFYDLAKHALRIESIDAGARSIVFDAMGREIERSDSKGARVLGSYDVLGRPDRTWARNDGNQAMTLRQRTFYGDAGDPNQPTNARNQARAGNLLGRITRQLDEAGELDFSAYDFKGNVSEKVRRVIADAPLIAALNAPGGPARGFTVDWGQPPALAGNYQTSYTYDALNRITTLQYPQDVNGARNELVPGYNNAGALESVRVDNDIFVERIAYNAKGQRVLIVYGNRLITRYAYDADTMRLARMRTEASAGGAALTYALQGAPLQDFAYEYDLAGNILRITEQIPGCGVRNNAQASLYPQLQAKLAAGDALVRVFEYDPLYRLTLAAGREANNIPTNGRPWGDLPRDGFDWGTPGTPTSQTARDHTRLYKETYSYDAADNMLTLGHGTWTRYFGISGLSPKAWAQEWPTHLNSTNAWATATSNRLTHVGTRTSATPTHFFDANGNLVRENTERHFAWDATDRMMAFANRASGGNATSEACYLYDSAGQRTKKLVRKGPSVEVTVYIDGLFEHHIVGAQENNSLHVKDDKNRIALIRVGFALQGDTGPDVQYQLGDHLGSSHIVVGGSDSRSSAFTNREEFFPYGETSFGSFGKKRFRYVGRERDEESGLNYHLARYFSPILCRWLSADPAGALDGVNLYAAFKQSPVTYVDITGFGSDVNGTSDGGSDRKISPQAQTSADAGQDAGRGPKEDSNRVLLYNTAVEDKPSIKLRTNPPTDDWDKKEESARWHHTWQIAPTNDKTATSKGLASVLEGAKTFGSKQSITTLGILVHGDREGRIDVAGDVIAAENVSEYADRLKELNKFLAPNADIFLYGCIAGYGTLGDKLLTDLSKLFPGHRVIGFDTLTEAKTESVKAGFLGGWVTDLKSIQAQPLGQRDTGQMAVKNRQTPEDLAGVRDATDAAPQAKIALGGKIVGVPQDERRPAATLKNQLRQRP